VRVNGVPLHYERRGSGEPLLLITGFTISSAVFEPVLDRYSKHFEVVMYDHRGSARSKGTSPSTMGALADDGLALLKTLGLPRAHVYGLSMGGMVALEMALRRPERVNGLILGGTSAGGPFAPVLGPLDVLAIARGAIRERGIRAPLLFSPEFRKEHPERARELVSYFKLNRSSVATIAAQTGASALHATLSRLHGVRPPTLVMHGGADRLVPLAAGRLLASRIPDAELAVIEGAGHAYALEKPQESLDLLLGWLERRLPRPTSERNRHVALDR
jgi:pimeloyl-ACP methyl ester carboxylesterase